MNSTWSSYGRSSTHVSLSTRPSTAEAWEGLLAAMRKGHMVTMEDARDYYAKYGDITKATRVTALRPTISSA